MSASLLVELFTEELPPTALKQLGEAFGYRLQDGLIRAQLKDNATSDTRIFATPRRLAVIIKDVRRMGLDRSGSKKLMPSKVAFGADGKPSAALIKRLEKEGAAAAQLERRIEGDTEYAFLNQTIPGVTLAAGLQTALQDAIARLPIPKLMSYQLADGATTVQFVRPAHGLVALYGGEIVDVSVLGLKAGRVTHGHRFQGVPDIPIAAADAYEEALAAHGQVIASFDARRAETERQLRAKSAQLGASLGPEDDVAPLLDEVTALIEYPSVYVGEFEPEFLAVPQECLILTMRQNQKYFPLFDAAAKLTNKFLIVSNMRLADPKNIVEGNQRVVGPRLEDARFFYNQDRKQRLEERVPQLARVVYHNKLGSQLERVERVQLLAGKIARALGADAAAAERAAWLAKADLLTNMVGEFPDLQGVMGRYYAMHDKEAQVVADAVEGHYRPRYSGDALPQGQVAAALALADKLDTLVGIFGIGMLPTGDKDPFALRRHAVGVLRILMETPLALDLFELLDHAQKCFPSGVLNHNPKNLRDFFGERLKNYLRESGEEPTHIEAVIAQLGGLIHEAPKRLLAVQHFARLPEARDLAAANKRVLNIIKKNEEIGYKFSSPNRALMKEAAEIALMDAVERLTPIAERDFSAGNYEGNLKLLAGIKPDVDRFFDEVMVMVEDQKIRNNRAALLQQLGILMNRVADISKLAA